MGYPQESPAGSLIDGASRGSTSDDVQDDDGRFREMMDALPAAVYQTDAQGRLTYFNQACVDLSGRVPVLGTDHWCVT